VTADHGMVIDGLVINASTLVNGDTIDFVPISELDDSFTVYHVETVAHDVILANGIAIRNIPRRCWPRDIRPISGIH
jgi:hypothetical protein